MKIQRIERHQISRNHPMWNSCDELCLKSKNLYNYANYLIRNNFFETKK